MFSSSFRLYCGSLLKSLLVIFHKLIIFIVCSDGKDDRVSHSLLQELFDLVILFLLYIQPLQIVKTLGYHSVKSTTKPIFALM